MKAIVNKAGETVAYLYLTIILDKHQTNVLGIVLGNCVFGSKKEPVGKFFNDIFRKKNGKIIALLGEKSSAKTPDNQADILLKAWKRLSELKEHTCAWVEEKDSWTKESFEELLAEK
ncbi:MAG: hypothetical protein IKD55_08425 [Sediminibacterium sp.]|nr:hypothetical protein [Sediminibacterium sp.]MBX9778714.1 hypothetical protein [Chitinophagaceae bacterium]